MKRIGIALLLFLVSFSLFAAPKPSIEGRASVAEENVFPTGLFAKAIGFLPGDSVTVTNPVSGISVNVLILGTPEKDGIAILLSPEAASRLFIAKDSNAIVSVTKRIAQPQTTAGPNPGVVEPIEIPPELEEKLRNQQNQDTEEKIAPSTAKPMGSDVNIGYGPDVRMSGENPSGAAIASLPGTSSNMLLIPPDSNVRVVPSDSNSPQSTTPPKNIESPRETVRVTDSGTASQPTESAAANAVKTPSEIVRITGTDTASQPIEGTATNTIKTPSETVRVTGADATTSQPTESAATNTIKTPSETVRVTGADATSQPTEGAVTNAIKTPSEIVRVTGADATSQPTESAATNAIKTPSETVRVTGTDATSQPTESTGVIPFQTTGENVKVTEGARQSSSDTATVDVPKKIENPVTGTARLLPAPPVKPPESAEDEVTTPPASKTDESIALDLPSAEKSQAVTPPSESNLESYIVDSANLRGGSYYVQIATMPTSGKNINGVVSEYRDKYPIALVLSTSAKNAVYQVLIGPLNVDEYGAVLERFKSNGFKDAWAKQIR